ncbi:DyP-type peroxidase [Mycena venus]|uniref:DyP-type peroxidase n=1 Tax=Mycena venus TaxID=2733690 RepID=A0A8H7CV49_9AGAR|nr:DyP-type peroxidase [Mycena venus]
MKLSINFVSMIILFSGLVSALERHDSSSAFKHRRGPLKPRRTSSLLINPDAQPDLPTAEAATAAAAAAGLNLDDIQGDVLVGMKKNQELFYFFSIANATDFKPKLASDILPLITTTSQLLDVSTQPITAINIAFSQTGLTSLGVTDALGDSAFAGGQLKDLKALGDPSSTNWVPEFAGTGIHGVILFASDSVDNINSAVSSLEAALGDSITKVYSLQAAARPGAEAGHEHFGFLDGISNPAVSGFTTNPMPGQSVISAGSILVGETGDTVTTRPAWAKDGSFLVFRQLQQLVPEFNKFLTDNPIIEDGLTAEQGLGAPWRAYGWPLEERMVPPSTSPRSLTTPHSAPTPPGTTTLPLRTRTRSSPLIRPDAPSLLTSVKRVPVPIWVLPKRPYTTSCAQEFHTGLKYNFSTVSDDEAASSTTSTERGLAFVAYQSNINNGFRFLQQTWANSANFVHAGVGLDPVIGALAGAQRVIAGLDPTNSTKTTTLTTDFVVSRGGEYFFSPSLSAIASTLSV